MASAGIKWYRPSGKQFQFISVAQSCLTLCDCMNRSMPTSFSITNSWSLLKLMYIESVMPSSYLIFCHPLLLLPPIPPNIRVFSNSSTLRMRWPRYWSFIGWHCSACSPSPWSGKKTPRNNATCNRGVYY